MGFIKRLSDGGVINTLDGRGADEGTTASHCLMPLVTREL